MSVVISRDYVLSLPDSGGDTPTANNPLIGYKNEVTITNIAATASDSSYPVTNLSNAFTNSRWKGTGIGTQYLTVTGITEETNYLAIAVHNFYTSQANVSVEGYTDVDSLSSPEWFELNSSVILPNDGPAMFVYEAGNYLGIRLKIAAASVIPYLAVLYVGKLLILQRRIFVGHTPINYGRDDDIVNGGSESGNFLGRIIINSSLMNSINLKNLTQTWYRSDLDPMIEACRLRPFFFAWRPDTYPYEIGYCIITNKPKPVNQSPNGFMQIEIQTRGMSV